MGATASPHVTRPGDGGIHWGWAIGGALALLAVLVAAAFAWVGLWSVRHAGASEAELAEYARRASPIVALLLSGPLYYAAGRFLRRQLGSRARRSALALVGLDALLSLASLFTSPAPLYPALMCALATGVKLVASQHGVRSGGAEVAA